TNSCDVYFYELARRLGIDPIEKVAKKFGLGSPSIPGAFGEKKGLIPGRDWKRANLDASWQTGETLIAGIGQGYMLVTPIQLAVMTARIANGGKAVVPKLLIDPEDVVANDQNVSRANEDIISTDMDAAEKNTLIQVDPEHIKLMHKAMTSVVNNPDGTAFGSRFNLRGVASAGKTGTVQVRRISKDERESGIIPNEELDWHLRDHALFVGFAPVKNPKYAVAVVVEHGGSGSKVAAPIAQKLLKMTLERDRQPNKTKTARANAFNKTIKTKAGKA
ncbi:MAG TPA: penicillin-binding protein 2, partial [Rhodobiaceae bacterium]|nr:penicillin-binding protein 2 [Rhodobiaceae bacterium]